MRIEHRWTGFCVNEEISMSDIGEATNLIMQYLNALDSRPEAIMTADDILAVPAQKALQQLGIQIPVIGWNNSLFSQVATPTITSVDIDMKRLARQQ